MPRYRSFYRRAENTSLGAPESFSTEGTDSRLATPISLTSLAPTNSPVTDHLPLSIFRPRTRPHQMRERTGSIPTLKSSPEEGVFPLQEGQLPVEGDVFVQRQQTQTTEPFPPFLQRDRRSAVRLSVWRAPSFNESLSSLLFSRGNRQILLFCLGFIFPLGELH